MYLSGIFFIIFDQSKQFLPPPDFYFFILKWYVQAADETKNK